MNYDGEAEAQAAIVKIALCGKYQKQYSDLKTACARAEISPYETELIYKWKQHGQGYPINEIDRLYYYFKENEPERFNKSVYCYEKNKRSTLSYCL